jgi:hypothetical protein
MAVRLAALCAGRPLPPQEDSWYSFLLKAKSTPRATVRLEGLDQLKIHLIGTRTRDLPACSIVPQPRAPRPVIYYYIISSPLILVMRNKTHLECDVTILQYV